MRYYVLNQQNQYFEFKNWENLIKWIRNTYPQVWNHFGHNLNDTYTQINTTRAIGYGRYTRLPINFVVFDEGWRVVRVEDLEVAVSEPVKRRIRELKYQYRYDPVPFCCKWNNSSSFFKSGAKLQDRRAYERDKDIIPNLKKPKYTDPWDDIVSSWARDCNKTWKRKKIKKQWMKHI